MGQRKVFAAIFCLVLLAGVAFAVAFLPEDGASGSAQRANPSPHGVTSSQTAEPSVSAEPGETSERSLPQGAQTPALSEQTEQPAVPETALRENGTEGVSADNSRGELDTPEVEISTEPATEDSDDNGTKERTGTKNRKNRGDRDSKKSESEQKKKTEGKKDPDSTSTEQDNDVHVDENGNILLPEVP